MELLYTFFYEVLNKIPNNQTLLISVAVSLVLAKKVLPSLKASLTYEGWPYLSLRRINWTQSFLEGSPLPSLDDNRLYVYPEEANSMLGRLLHKESAFTLIKELQR